jgi:hypothetical protein
MGVRTLDSDVENIMARFFEGPVCLPAQKHVARASLESHSLDQPEIRSGDHAASWLGFPSGNCRGRRVT